MIESLNEVDTDLKYKDVFVSYLQDAIKLLSESFPIVFQLLEDGLDKITPEQFERISAFEEFTNSMQNRSKEISDLSLKFHIKHNITAEELKRNDI